VPIVSILTGLVLVLLGLDGYFDLVGVVRPDKLRSPTALIPAGFGAALVVCGLVALNERRLKHAMHAAATIGLVGFLAGAGMGLPRALAAEGGLSPGVRSQLWLAGVCGAFVLLCVNSFLAARRRRVGGGPPAA
jgi:hypothetical protein